MDDVPALERFLAGRYALRNYVTANGYGAFDLAYDPRASRCEVRVRVAFRFEDAPPAVWSRLAPDDDAGHAGHPAALLACFWTEASRARFVRDFAGHVRRVWNARCALRCVHPVGAPWSALHAAVGFDVLAVDEPAAAHFHALVRALPPGQTTRVRLSGADHRAPPGGPAGAVDAARFAATALHMTSGDVHVRSYGSAFGGAATRQVPAVHEFGHLLGLDEQYACDAREPGGPNDSGQRTSACAGDEDRVMDGGERVLPEHCATIVDALNAATWPVRFAAESAP